MKLLTSQKDALYDMIQNSGLSPSQFEFTDDNISSYSPGKTSTWLHFKNSEYLYKFESIQHQNAKHYSVYCPGKDAHTEEAFPGSWESQLNYFSKWITYLLREINSPNKWDRLKTEIAGIKINFENNEDKFTIPEHEELKTKINLLKQGIKTIGLQSEQVIAINSKLDHLTEIAKDMNKFDWKSLFIGTTLNIIIQLGVTQDNAKSLWDLIKQIFNTYFLP